MEEKVGISSLVFYPFFDIKAILVQKSSRSKCVFIWHTNHQLSFAQNRVTNFKTREKMIFLHVYRHRFVTMQYNTSGGSQIQPSIPSTYERGTPSPISNHGYQWMLTTEVTVWSWRLQVETFETLMDYFPQIRYAETSSFLKNGSFKVFQFILIEN